MVESGLLRVSISRPCDTPTSGEGTVRFMSTIALSAGSSMRGHQVGAKTGFDRDDTIGWPACVWKVKAPIDPGGLGGVPP